MRYNIAPKIAPKIICLRKVFLPLNGLDSIVLKRTLDFFPILQSKTIIPKAWPNNKATTKPATAKGKINNNGRNISTPGIPSTIEYRTVLIEIDLTDISGTSIL